MIWADRNLEHKIHIYDTKLMGFFLRKNLFKVGFRFRDFVYMECSDDFFQKTGFSNECTGNFVKSLCWIWIFDFCWNLYSFLSLVHQNCGFVIYLENCCWNLELRIPKWQITWTNLLNGPGKIRLKSIPLIPNTMGTILIWKLLLLPLEMMYKLLPWVKDVTITR